MKSLYEIVLENFPEYRAYLLADHCMKCPFCTNRGGDDYLYFKIIKPNDPKKETYACIQCKARGDAIDFLMAHKLMTYQEASAEVLSEKN